MKDETIKKVKKNLVSLISLNFLKSTFKISLAIIIIKIKFSTDKKISFIDPKAKIGVNKKEKYNLKILDEMLSHSLGDT